MADIIERLRIESQREPNKPIWRDAIDEIDALRAEVERLRAIAGCAYQMAGVHDAPEVWLDRLGQAANGDALPDPDTISDELLPYQPDAVCEAEARAERLAEALRIAEAALADIGDADREPGDDVSWCKRRAALGLRVVRDTLRNADIRFACGDNGKRMQPELVEYIRELAEDAAKYRWALNNSRWIRGEHAAYVAIPVAREADLSCVAMRDAAIDQARGKAGGEVEGG